MIRTVYLAIMIALFLIVSTDGFAQENSDGPEDSGNSDASGPIEEEGEDRSGPTVSRPHSEREPSDVFGIGYNEFFDSLLGKEPREKHEVSLGVNYNDYFREKQSEFGPSYKDYKSAYVGRYPGYREDGMMTFRTIGTYTTHGYTIGYYLGKAIVWYVTAKAPVTRVAPTSTAGKAVAKTARDKALSQALPDLMGEIGSGYGNLLDNRDVISHNVQRTFQILNSPSTYMGPLGTSPFR